jgi:hypothetical protein
MTLTLDLLYRYYCTVVDKNDNAERKKIVFFLEEKMSGGKNLKLSHSVRGLRTGFIFETERRKAEKPAVSRVTSVHDLKLGGPTVSKYSDRTVIGPVSLRLSD